jgi:hypothetical protein
MLQLAYVSSAKSPFSEAQLVALLTKSRANNEAAGVTGLLLYRDGNFIQAIEGEREAVTALHRKIATDPRHHGLITMYTREVEAREFAQWSMGFRNLADPSVLELPGYSTFLEYDFMRPPTSDGVSKLRRLLEMFRVNTR